MGMNPSAHFPPTSHRQIFFAFSKTSYLLSHSTYDTNRCSCMPMTQRDGETVLWRSLAKKALMAPIAQANVSTVLSQMSRSGSPWGGKGWRVPWGPSLRNSRAGLPLRGFFKKKELSHLLILTLSGGLGTNRHLQISKNFLHIHHKTGIWMVQLQLQTLTLGREHHQQMSTVHMWSQDFKTSN